MSSNGPREPMWYCHSCHAEMRPLTTQDPVCASCHSSFVEMLENENDDPRQDAIPFDIPFFSNTVSRNASHHDENDDRSPAGAGAGGLFDMISTLLQPSTVGEFGNNRGDGGIIPSGGYTMVFGGPSGTRTVQVGGRTIGAERVGGDGDQQPGRIPTLFEFLATAQSQANGNNGPQRSPASLLATYILSGLLRNSNGDLPAGIIEPFDGTGGRFGDYVLNEEALQALLNELMGGGGAPAEPPTPQNIIDELPRVVFEGNNPLFNEACSVCHEPFNPALAASPDANAESSSNVIQKPDSHPSDSQVELLGITLPCKHTFHEDCILPWLRMKSTCPVCRMSLLPQSNSSRQDEGPSQRNNDPGHEEPPPIPGGWDSLD